MIKKYIFENETFAGIEISIKTPGDGRSNLDEIEKKTLLLGDDVYAGYSVGHDVYDVSYSYAISIAEKHKPKEM